MRNAYKSIVIYPIVLWLIFLSIFTISSLCFAAEDISREIAMLKEEIKVAQAKLDKAKPGQTLEAITLLVSIKNMQKILVSLNQKAGDVKNLAGPINNLNIGLKALEQATHNNDKSGARKALNDMTAALKALEAEAAKAGREKTISKSAVPGKLSAKIENFLKAIEKAGSLEEVDKAFKSAHFSQAELRGLGEETNKPPYINKLKSLSSKAKALGEGKIKAEAQRKRQESDQKSKQELNRLKQQTLAKLPTLQIIEGPRPKGPPPLEYIREARAVRPPLPDNPARITRYTPEPAIVGQEITIIGENFGTRRGDIRLDIEGLRVSITEISSWGNTAIILRIPLGLETTISETEKSGRIWIEAERNTATTLIRIAPDLSQLTPVITRVVSDEGGRIVAPGLDARIGGSHFLARSGSVNFRLVEAGITYPGEILSWSDTAITARMRSDIEGVKVQQCELEVVNTLGQRSTTRILFWPIWVNEELYAYHYLDYSWVIWGGKERATDHDFTLINDWFLSSAWLSWWVGGVSGGCRYIREAVIGSRNPNSRIEYWADLYSLVDCYNYIRITGPKGLPYR